MVSVCVWIMHRWCFMGDSIVPKLLLLCLVQPWIYWLVIMENVSRNDRFDDKYAGLSWVAMLSMRLMRMTLILSLSWVLVKTVQLVRRQLKRNWGYRVHKYTTWLKYVITCLFDRFRVRATWPFRRPRLRSCVCAQGGSRMPPPHLASRLPARYTNKRTISYTTSGGISTTTPTSPSKSTGAYATPGAASGSIPSNCTTDRASPSSSRSGCWKPK